MIYRQLTRALFAFLFWIGFIVTASAQTPGPCARPAAGSDVRPPPELFSHDGVLNVGFNYYTQVDGDGRTLFCFVTPDGLEAPTLHVMPGDTINLSVTNTVPPPPPGSPTEVISNSTDRCGDSTMTITSLNVHFHGTNTSPKCHEDNVVRTIINSNENFQYALRIPANEAPGLYWYHPHVHSLAEAAVQGGASGVIVVGGIENYAPAVAGLRERVLVIRDQNVAGQPMPGGPVPSWDLSVNYVPVPYPSLTPGVIHMQTGHKEFWRVSNSSADSLVDLQVLYDGVAQPLKIVALDGVPLGSQDATVSPGSTVTQTHIFIATAGRAEFIVDGPPPGVKTAILQTLAVDTGPIGDNDTQRTLLTIKPSDDAPDLAVIPNPTGATSVGQFAGLDRVVPTAKRTLYFSEVLSDPNNALSPTNFYITVAGAKPVLFDANNPPAIVTTKGSVEDWTIQNTTGENHEFHMHQIHFLLMAVNGVPVPPEQRQYYDTLQVPYYSGTGPVPSVTVRMDFRGAVVGQFVYHCHILGHEDGGMMAIIQVNPADH